MNASKGDERRTALLAALEEHLESASLDDINIADISRRAGVARSAFYFYFENKAAAVAALYEEMYADGFGAAEVLGGDGTLRDRISSAIRAIVHGWRQRTHLNDRTLERVVGAPEDVDVDVHVEAVAHTWLAAIYGRTS